MADYQFLFNKSKEQAFVERCAVAVLVLAHSVVVDGTATEPEKAWAAAVMQSPESWGRRVAAIAVAANKDASESVIDGVTDATLQNVVNAAKGVLVAGNA